MNKMVATIPISRIRVRNLAETHPEGPIMNRPLHLCVRPFTCYALLRGKERGPAAHLNHIGCVPICPGEQSLPSKKPHLSRSPE